MYVLQGQEVTAVIPEHMTMLPVVPDGSPRGGWVEWYSMDIAELWAAMHERSGGGINILNHPGYLDHIGWDRVLAEPTLTDPTLLGLSADSVIWSWDLDGLEVMNGLSSPFMDGNHRFDNWQSMVNAGHAVVAVGCSDDHGGGETGLPRTYLEVYTDDPAELTDELVAEAMGAGRAVVSAGAFARVSVNGVGPGGLATASETVSLDIHVEALPEVDITHVVVFRSCDEVAVLAADDTDGVVKLSTSVEVLLDGEDANLVVAAFGDGDLPDGLPTARHPTPRVLTNPIFVDQDGDGRFGGSAGRECTYTLAAP